MYIYWWMVFYSRKEKAEKMLCFWCNFISNKCVFVVVGVICLNHNNYNVLKCDWCINCCILLCKVVIGQCNWTVGFYRTPVMGQLHERIILISTKSTNHNIAYNHYTYSRDWLVKLWRFSLQGLFWMINYGIKMTITCKGSSSNETFTFVGNCNCYD